VTYFKDFFSHSFQRLFSATYFKELAERRMRELVALQAENDRKLAELTGSMEHATGEDHHQQQQQL
jgi:hypothetical protein